MAGCCDNPTSWIFIYQNDEVYSICEDHFFSNVHRVLVRDVINFRTQKRYDPTKLFGENLIGSVH